MCGAAASRRSSPAFFLFISVVFLSNYSAFAGQGEPVDLQCEHLVNPIGIDVKSPRFQWRIDDSRMGAKQTAWRIVVGTDSAEVAAGNGSMWENQKNPGSNCQLVYAGKPLHSFTKYYWMLTSWTQQGDAIQSRLASFETAMLSEADWKAYWISDGKSPAEKAAPIFRKEWKIDKQIRSARAYVAAAGLFELYINGKKIGDHQMDPMYTRFDRRTLYVTHDITAALKAGGNAAGILMGNGWYNHQSTAVWDFDKAPWRNRPAFCLQLHIQFNDGSDTTIISDKSWKTDLSPVVYNSIYTAEHYDARKEQPGWNEPGFNDKEWKSVYYRSAPARRIVAQAMYPVRYVDTITAASVRKFNDQDFVFDIGRNIAGVSQIKIRGRAGTVIRLKHAERLYSNGHADQSNIDVHYRPTDSLDPFQTDIYILKGGGEEVFRPHFNYKGFQYVELTSSQPVSLEASALTAYFMHSDVPAIGQIHSSNEIINKIWWATNNSYLSNLFGYPTDCPQREKNGWTGDAHIAVETGLYNFNAVTVYEKWMADHRDEQQPNGVLSSIIPTDGWGYEWGNGPDWTSTIAIIPWELYLFYGDSKALRDCYPNIRRYVDHIDELYPSGLTSWGLGDWVPVKSVSPVELTSTAYYYKDVSILAKAATLFGYEADAKKYTVLAEKIKSAFNKKYLSEEKGIYGKGLQTELAVPLYMQLVPEEYVTKVAGNLADSVKANGYHLDCGILGTKAILPALSENGFADVAYKLAAQTTYPSWGWWMVNGATTLYENWKIDAASDISMNHIMFGGIGGWLYSGMAGIQPDETAPGFSHFYIKPAFVVDKFSATHASPAGDISVEWQETRKRINLNIVIPANSSATLILPLSQTSNIEINGKRENGNQFELEAGTYELNFRR